MRRFLDTKQYPILFRTTKYWKVLLIIFCATKYYSSTIKYYSSTTPYYEILLPSLLQYYSILQTLLQYYYILQTTTPILENTIPILLRPTKFYSSTTLYHKVTLILVIFEILFRICRATGITLQPHQILRLTCKTTHIFYLRDIWNVIYHARSNRCHPPTSANTAPAPQKDSHT